jgi:hypothetical protein
MNFYSGVHLLVQVGNRNHYIRWHGGRRENFYIADDEQLIGCEIDQDKDYFYGITWLKMKIL